MIDLKYLFDDYKFILKIEQVIFKMYICRLNFYEFRNFKIKDS
jgi:hypothetical protein